MEIITTMEKVNDGIEELKENGGEVLMKSGSIGQVSIQGVDAKFSFSNGILTVLITDKPWLVSQEYVEEKIREYFN